MAMSNVTFSGPGRSVGDYTVISVKDDGINKTSSTSTGVA